MMKNAIDFYPDYGFEKCYDEQLYHFWEVWQKYVVPKPLFAWI